ncbi:hypothetical protein ENU1_133170 [Entamoeba nuttalli P19]|uniref:Uncharacterized protein n=1 Tax=Entamoeba nuttalli (strain P19) TaxID=1076696 RepID=K2GVZ4_ENTNP|nr:hypothetical protein ENU1_133170 [Entamoeba nuttalli P19]EKE39323.1 hypothetical protein ENU1_133170 [Entamoeba nuttalli P19]|eukprot:XP_008858336.1 hypothetical protein ENU1_133170 [Entamoeba nuttalli P19]
MIKIDRVIKKVDLSFLDNVVNVLDIYTGCIIMHKKENINEDIFLVSISPIEGNVKEFYVFSSQIISNPLLTKQPNSQQPLLDSSIKKIRIIDTVLIENKVVGYNTILREKDSVISEFKSSVVVQKEFDSQLKLYLKRMELSGYEKAKELVLPHNLCSITQKFDKFVIKQLQKTKKCYLESKVDNGSQFINHFLQLLRFYHHNQPIAVLCSSELYKSYYQYFNKNSRIQDSYIPINIHSTLSTDPFSMNSSSYFITKSIFTNDFVPYCDIAIFEYSNLIPREWLMKFDIVFQCGIPEETFYTTSGIIYWNCLLNTKNLLPPTDVDSFCISPLITIIIPIAYHQEIEIKTILNYEKEFSQSDIISLLNESSSYIGNNSVCPNTLPSSSRYFLDTLFQLFNDKKIIIVSSSNLIEDIPHNFIISLHKTLTNKQNASDFKKEKSGTLVIDFESVLFYGFENVDLFIKYGSYKEPTSWLKNSLGLNRNTLSIELIPDKSFYGYSFIFKKKDYNDYLQYVKTKEITLKRFDSIEMMKIFQRINDEISYLQSPIELNNLINRESGFKENSLFVLSDIVDRIKSKFPFDEKRYKSQTEFYINLLYKKNNSQKLNPINLFRTNESKPNTSLLPPITKVLPPKENLGNNNMKKLPTENSGHSIVKQILTNSLSRSILKQPPTKKLYNNTMKIHGHNHSATDITSQRDKRINTNPQLTVDSSIKQKQFYLSPTNKLKKIDDSLLSIPLPLRVPTKRTTSITIPPNNNDVYKKSDSLRLITGNRNVNLTQPSTKSKSNVMLRQVTMPATNNVLPPTIQNPSIDKTRKTNSFSVTLDYPYEILQKQLDTSNDLTKYKIIKVDQSYKTTVENFQETNTVTNLIHERTKLIDFITIIIKNESIRTNTYFDTPTVTNEFIKLIYYFGLDASTLKRNSFLLSHVPLEILNTLSYETMKYCTYKFPQLKNHLNFVEYIQKYVKEKSQGVSLKINHRRNALWTDGLVDEFMLCVSIYGFGNMEPILKNNTIVGALTRFNFKTKEQILKELKRKLSEIYFENH